MSPDVNVGIQKFRNLDEYMKKCNNYFKLYIICKDITADSEKKIQKDNLESKYKKIIVYTIEELQINILENSLIIFPLNPPILNDKLPIMLLGDPISKALDLEIGDILIHNRNSTIDDSINYYYRKVV